MAERKINWDGPQPAPAYLGGLLRANFPQISATGIYNNRNVAGTSRKSSHAEGRDSTFISTQLTRRKRPWGIACSTPSSERLRRSGWTTSSGIGRSGALGSRLLASGSIPGRIHTPTTFTWNSLARGASYRRSMRFLIEVGIIRTGYDDLQKALGNFG